MIERESTVVGIVCKNLTTWIFVESTPYSMNSLYVLY